MTRGRPSDTASVVFLVQTGMALTLELLRVGGGAWARAILLWMEVHPSLTDAIPERYLGERETGLAPKLKTDRKGASKGAHFNQGAASFLVLAACKDLDLHVPRADCRLCSPRLISSSTVSQTRGLSPSGSPSETLHERLTKSRVQITVTNQMPMLTCV